MSTTKISAMKATALATVAVGAAVVEIVEEAGVTAAVGAVAPAVGGGMTRP